MHFIFCWKEIQFSNKYISWQVWKGKTKLRSVASLFFKNCDSIGIMAAPLRAPRNPSDHHSTIALKGLRGALNFPPLFRETPASRASDVHFFQSGCQLMLISRTLFFAHKINSVFEFAVKVTTIYLLLIVVNSLCLKRNIV